MAEEARPTLAALGTAVPDELLSAYVHVDIEPGALFFDFTRPDERPRNKWSWFSHFAPHYGGT